MRGVSNERRFCVSEATTKQAYQEADVVVSVCRESAFWKYHAELEKAFSSSKLGFDEGDFYVGRGVGISFGATFCPAFVRDYTSRSVSMWIVGREHGGYQY